MTKPVGSAWTVLIYTSASPDLREAVTASLQEISDGYDGSKGDVQVVAQMGSNSQLQRFRLDGADQPQPLDTPRPGEMTDPGELRRFVEWGMREYPAQRYVVVLGGHGAGFAGAVTDSKRQTMVSLPDLKQQLTQLPQRPEMVVFNTCLMAQAEVAEQLQGTADFLVASQSQLKGLGLPLAAWMSRLSEHTPTSAAARALQDESEKLPERAPMVSALDLARWPLVRDGMDGLAEAILSHPAARPRLLQHLSELEDCWPRPQDRPVVDQRDLGEFCQRISEDVELPEHLRRGAESLGQSLREQGAKVSVYLPDRPFEHLGLPDRRVGKIYAELDLSRATRWDEALYWLVSGTAGDSGDGTLARSSSWPSLS